MNTIEKLIRNNQAYKQTDHNGDTYPVHGGGAPNRDTPQNEAISYNSPKDTLYDLPVNDAVTKRQSDAIKLKNYQRKEAEDNSNTVLRNVAESSRAEGQYEGAAQMKQKLEEDLYNRTIENMKKDIGVNDINSLRMGDAAADAQGVERSNTPWSIATREVAGDMDRINSVEQNTNLFNNTEGFDSTNIRSDIGTVLEESINN